MVRLFMPPEPENELTTEELARIDKLLGAARTFHYSAFTLSGVSFILSSLEKTDRFKLPIGDVLMPHLQTVVGIYLLVLVLTMCAERMFRMAYPWMQRDKRGPPFAWIALSPRDPTFRSVTFWLILPIVVCGISTAISLDRKDLTGIVLSFIGAILFLTPRLVEQNWYLITKRLDHRGGSATLSMWLLYWVRLGRGVILIIFWFAPVIAVVPRWRSPIWDISYPIMIFMAAITALRGIAGIPFFYRRIDRLGSRFNFPAQSQHYK
jgi:hypothetical protein